MIPEVGKPNALAARKANEVKKVNLVIEVVWDLNCKVATWVESGRGEMG